MFVLLPLPVQLNTFSSYNKRNFDCRNDLTLQQRRQYTLLRFFTITPFSLVLHTTVSRFCHSIVTREIENPFLWLGANSFTFLVISHAHGCHTCAVSEECCGYSSCLGLQRRITHPPPWDRANRNLNPERIRTDTAWGCSKTLNMAVSLRRCVLRTTLYSNWSRLVHGMVAYNFSGVCEGNSFSMWVTDFAGSIWHNENQLTYMYLTQSPPSIFLQNSSTYVGVTHS